MPRVLVTLSLPVYLAVPVEVDDVADLAAAERAARAVLPNRPVRVSAQACPVGSTAHTVTAVEAQLVKVEAVELERRACCAGPLPDGRHFVNCTAKCWDCYGDPDGPGRCRCADPVTVAVAVGESGPDTWEG